MNLRTGLWKTQPYLPKVCAPCPQPFRTEKQQGPWGGPFLNRRLLCHWPKFPLSTFWLHATPTSRFLVSCRDAFPCAALGKRTTSMLLATSVSLSHLDIRCKALQPHPLYHQKNLSNGAPSQACIKNQKNKNLPINHFILSFSLSTLLNFFFSHLSSAFYRWERYAS